MRLRFPPYKTAAPASPVFSIKAVNLLLKMSHLDMYKALASASPFLTAEGDETPSKNASS